MAAALVTALMGWSAVCDAASQSKSARQGSVKVKARSSAVLAPGDARALGSPEPRYVGESISLDLKDADIRDVLLTFAKLTRMNMVIDPEVKGTVTVWLENVPWDQALDVILKSNGLGYVLEGNLVRVAEPVKLQATP